MSETSSTKSTDVAGQLAELFSTLRTNNAEEVLRAIEPFYAENMTFQDPLQKVLGRGAFIKANQKLVSICNELQFTVTDHAETENSAYLVWTLVMQMRLGPRVTIDGVTHLRKNGELVIEHRDYWDLLSSLMHTVPIAGPVYQAFTRFFV